MTEIVVRKEKKHIGKIGLAIAVGAGAAIVVILVALIALSGVFTGTGLADPPGGALFAGGAAVVPSDEDGGIVRGDGFTVETIGTGIQSKSKKPNLYDQPARIENVRFEKIKERKEDGMIEIQLTYKLVPTKTKFYQACSRVFITTGPPEFKKIKSDISSCGCSIHRRSFNLFPEDGHCNIHNYTKYKTAHILVTSYAEYQNGDVRTPFYKVSCA